MSNSYLSLLKRQFKCFSFRTDSAWSWIVAIVGFATLVSCKGLAHCLGVFFPSWTIKFKVSTATLIWVQSALYGCTMLCGPIAILVTKAMPGQILLVFCGIVNCCMFQISAFLGQSVVVLIVLNGCVVGIGCAFFVLYSMNLVAKAFRKFRPIAIAAVNLGAPIGSVVMPYVASSLLSGYGLTYAMMGLGLIWLLNSLLSVFLVEINEEAALSSSKENGRLSEDPKKTENHCLHHLKIIKSPKCICLMIYGFFHFGGMVGTVIFLPPLLTESLIPTGNASKTAMDIGQDELTMALSFYGGGGFAGNILIGLVMTFGPLARKRFALFVTNNIVLLISAVLLIFVQTFEPLCLVVTILGFSYECWFSLIWTIIYDMFSVSEAPDVSGLLSFSWGVATFFVQFLSSTILELTSEDINSNGTAVFEADNFSAEFSTSNITITNEISSQRSFGNQMVMTMMCGFLACATFAQCFLYVLEKRSSEAEKGIRKRYQ